MSLVAKGQTFVNIRGLVARVLLDHAGNSADGGSRLTQREIAAMIGADWGMVHMSLESLLDEGAIRIEHHRIIINQGSLQKIARAKKRTT